MIAVEMSSRVLLGSVREKWLIVDTSRKTITFAKWLGRPAGGHS
jgi:hypothetical protein